MTLNSEKKKKICYFQVLNLHVLFFLFLSVKTVVECEQLQQMEN